MGTWYAVHTHTHAEEKALRHLENQGFFAYLPRFLKLRRHARRRDWIKMPLFPRYLFIRFDAKTTPWRAINSTFGVQHLVGVGNEPLSVPDHIVAGIRSRENERGLIDLEAERPLCPGDRVQILAGPMRELIGLFECKTGEERVIVLLELLGRAVKVCVPRESVTVQA